MIKTADCDFGDNKITLWLLKKQKFYELANSTKFLRHFYNEIVSEYSCFFDQDQLEKELEEFDETERNGEMFAQTFANDAHQGSLVSFYQPSDTGDQTSAKILSNVDVKLQVNRISFIDFSEALFFRAANIITNNTYEFLQFLDFDYMLSTFDETISGLMQ